MRALSVRRKATIEIFKAAMKQGKFGITYTKSLADKVPGFIDYVMIEAATLKRLPMFMTASFNVRAEAVIQESNVVPLIRFEHFVSTSVSFEMNDFVFELHSLIVTWVAD